MNTIMLFIGIILVCYMCFRAAQINIEAIRKLNDPNITVFKKIFSIFVGLLTLIVYGILAGLIMAYFYETYKIPY